MTIANDGFVISLPPATSPPPTPPGAPAQADVAWSIAHLTYPFGTYEILTIYTWSNGMLQGPVMAPTGQVLAPCSLINWCQPYGRKDVRWSVRRSGQQPLVPDPNPNDPNLTLAGFAISLMNTMLQEDGGVDYECSGSYSYFCAIPVPPSTGYTFAAVPYSTVQKQQLNAGQFVQSLI